MKKIKKFLVMICLTSGLALPIGVQASATSKVDTASNISIDNKIMEAFPNLKNEQIAKGYTEVVSSKDTYLKCTPKESTKESMKKDKQQLTQPDGGAKTKYTSEDFIITEVPEAEYKIAEARQKSSKLAPSIKSVYSDEDYYTSHPLDDGYLHMNTIIYRNYRDGYKFLARNEFVWLNLPNCTLTDAAGISVGNAMTIYTDSYSGQINHTQEITDPSSPTGWSYRTWTDDATGLVYNPNGIAAKYDIWGGTQDMGYIQCEVGFTQYNGVHQESVVFGNYAHARLAFTGSISLSTSGSISLGFGILDKMYSNPCNVAAN